MTWPRTKWRLRTYTRGQKLDEKKLKFQVLKEK